jgi:Ca2+-binding RTX toxin-like protein
MRRTVLSVFWVTLAVLMASGASLAATVTGTPQDEKLVGTRYADTIDARGGDDAVLGRRGKDIIRGGRGRDVLRGGRGNDSIDSGDVILPSGGFKDLVDCGSGNDTAVVDSDERVVDCEEVRIAAPGGYIE